jgi:predicted enzyme related to lactoylglutathione lyase
MAVPVNTIIIPVQDLARAKTLYSALLGVPPTTDAPYYVGYNVEGQEIGLDPNGHGRGMTAPVPFCHVSDVKASVQALVAAGATVQQEPTDVGGGTLIATVKDGDGNVIGLRQAS